MERTRLLEDPQLRPFLPMLWVAWADGDLEAHELGVLTERISQMPWLRPAARMAVESWLDPARPPSSAELTALFESLSRISPNLAPERRGSLVELGLALAPADQRTPEVTEALESLQALLWGGAQNPLFPAPVKEEGGAAAPFAHAAALRQRLDGECEAVREEVRRFLAEPNHRAYGLPPGEYRALVQGWLKTLAERGLGAAAYPGVTTERSDLSGMIAAFETLALGDLSLVVRFGVQFGLFGGSIYFLGTEAQRKKWLPSVASLQLPGCFAMSEVGHGSDVEGLETVATWQPESRTFVLHTPAESARKDWVGGAAQYAQLATVFAQLWAGDENHGIHAFVVPIRGPKGEPLPGVRTGDSGHKMGLNGVDNGRLWFDHVRVPEEALLSRFARFDAEGRYQSELTHPKKRFFTMLGTLVGGRISVAAASVSAAKVGLCIAVRYAATRRQFGGEDGVELPLLSYPTHERRLLPLLATTYVHHFAVETLRRRFASRLRMSAEVDVEDAPVMDARELEAAAAALKALTSWHAVHTARQCREACGGQGYLSVNRLPDLCADVEIFTTFEGDNTVLLQLVAKSLLAGYRRRFESKGLGGVIRQVMGRARTAVTEKNVLAVRRADAAHLRDRSFHLAALRFREEQLLTSAAARLRKRLAAKMKPQEALLEVQEHLVELAKAHAERLALEWFDEAMKQTDPKLLEPLERLGALHALTRIQAQAAFYLSEGYLDPSKLSAIRKESTRLLHELRVHAVPLVDAFGIPDACLAAPIAFMDPAHPVW